MRYALVPTDDDTPVVGAVGYLRKPTKWCKCWEGGRPAGVPTGKQWDGYVRGSTYGWWIHRACRKPRRAWWVAWMVHEMCVKDWTEGDPESADTEEL